jgi:RNA polymerase sigma-70 factor, ECF subfamily
MEPAAAAQQGDTRAFEQLVRSHMQRAYYTTLGMIGNHADALDISQNAFVKAWKNIRQLKDTSRFIPWFYTILRRETMDHLRRNNRRHESSLSDHPFVINTPDESEQEKRQQDETAEALWQGLKQLPENQREILIMQHFQELRYAEIAETLDIPIGSVASRLYEARQALRRQLNGLL